MATVIGTDPVTDLAELKAGDIIMEYQNKELTEMGMLPTLVAQTAISKRVNITIFRNEKEQKMSLAIGKLNNDTQADKVDKQE